MLAWHTLSGLPLSQLGLGVSVGGGVGVGGRVAVGSSVAVGGAVVGVSVVGGTGVEVAGDVGNCAGPSVAVGEVACGGG